MTQELLSTKQQNIPGATIDPVLRGWWVKFRTTPNGPYFVREDEVVKAQSVHYGGKRTNEEVAYCIALGKRCGAYRPEAEAEVLPFLDRLMKKAS